MSEPILSQNKTKKKKKIVNMHWKKKKIYSKVWLKKGSGNIHVNGLKMNEYFKRPVHQIIVTDH